MDAYPTRCGTTTRPVNGNNRRFVFYLPDLVSNDLNWSIRTCAAKCRIRGGTRSSTRATCPNNVDVSPVNSQSGIRADEFYGDAALRRCAGSSHFARHGPARQHRGRDPELERQTLAGTFPARRAGLFAGARVISGGQRIHRRVPRLAGGRPSRCGAHRPSPATSALPAGYNAALAQVNATRYCC